MIDSETCRRAAWHLRSTAFEPGEAFQLDWSADWEIIGNERTKLQVAHTKLSNSGAFIVRAYLLCKHPVGHLHGEEDGIFIGAVHISKIDIDLFQVDFPWESNYETKNVVAKPILVRILSTFR